MDFVNELTGIIALIFIVVVAVLTFMFRKKPESNA